MPSDEDSTFFIHDACLLIDLCAGGLLPTWFESGRRFATTTLVVAEVKTSAQKKALALRGAGERVQKGEMQNAGKFLKIA